MGLNLENIDPELRKKIENLQNLQRTLEFLSQQNMQIQSSLRETEVAIEELEKSSPDAVVYKSIGGIMVKSEVTRLLDEKRSLKVTLDMRNKTLQQKIERSKSQIESMSKSLQADLQPQ